MITKISNGVTVLTMGHGTLYSGIIRDEEGAPRGISFTSEKGSMKDAVIFQIESVQGFAGLLFPVINLMEEWEKYGVIVGDEIEIAEFKKAVSELKMTIEAYRPKAKE